MTLRSLKKQHTRQALADATWTLSLEHGFDQVTVDQIAASAVVSRRTFFRYFPTKESAFFADHQARLERFRAALTRGQRGERPYDTVRRCLLVLADELDAMRQPWTSRHRVIEASPALLTFELALDRQYEEAIVAALQPTWEGDPDSDVDGRLSARVMGSAMFGVVRAVLRQWVEDGSSPPLAELGAQALDLLESGFHDQRGVVVPLVLSSS